MPEEDSFEATSENRQRVQTWHVGADCSKYRQHCSSNREGPIANCSWAFYL